MIRRDQNAATAATIAENGQADVVSVKMTRKQSLDRKKAAKKDTYVNMTFTSPIASCSSAGSCPAEAKSTPVEIAVPTAIESTEEEDGEETVAIKPSVVKPKRFFSFRPLKMMQSGSFTLKNLSIDCQSNNEDKVEVSLLNSK